MLLLGPFIQGFVKLRVFMEICFSFIFVTAIYAISQKKQHMIVAAILAIPMLSAEWAQYFIPSKNMVTIGYVFGVCFFAFVAIRIFKYIFSAQEVTREIISAAILVYLLMALMWGFIYTALEMTYPGSFVSSQGEIQTPLRSHFIYYSFVTITTLGYGDVTPVVVQAKSLAIVEAITGQMYLVVVVAWLVGMFVSKKSK
jgi:hypothetical protein